MRLPPYSTYKPSGVEWLGEVPADWDVVPVKRQYFVQLGKMLQSRPNATGDQRVRYLKARNVQWFKIDLSKVDLMYASITEQDQYGVKAGDLLVCEGGEGGRCALVDNMRDNSPCIIQNALHRVRPHIVSGDEPVRNDYLQFILSAVSSLGWFDALNDKATIAHFTAEKFGALPIPMPSLAEQTSIVRYLDHATDQIERYIRAKEKLIALLEEQKQVMIHDAVTGRIDVRTGKPYPAYKLSGVEYLGEIPNEWNACTLQRLIIDRCDGPFGSGLKSSHYTDKGIRVIRLQNIRHGEFDASDAAYISTDHYATLGDHSVEESDVLIAGLGDSNHPAGRACVAPASIVPAMVKADCFRFRLKRDDVEPRFLAFQLTATASAVAGLLSTGATRQRVNLQSTSSRVVGIPPLHDQVRITSYVIAKSQHIHTVQNAARKEISLIREYRTRLIADVVTGKLDVREAAANLPELNAIADGGDEEISTESDSQQSNTTLHNEAPPTTPGVGS